jgi:hypothetical protein
MIIDLLHVFERNCGNRLPNRIVFYRDGVDDGQFQKVLDNEVVRVKNACRGKSYLSQMINQFCFYFLKLSMVISHCLD